MQELQAQAQQLLIGQEIPWRSLRDIVQQLQTVQPKADSPWIHEACKGSRLILSAPPKREKSKELLERLSRLQQQVDQNSYNKMVAEVTQQVVHFQMRFCSCSSMSQAGKSVVRTSESSVMQERAADALRSGALQTYKQQISFGLHVIVMMGTFFAVGYIAGTAISPNMAVVGAFTCAFASRLSIGSSSTYNPITCRHVLTAAHHVDVCLTHHVMVHWLFEITCWSTVIPPNTSCCKSSMLCYCSVQLLVFVVWCLPCCLRPFCS